MQIHAEIELDQSSQLILRLSGIMLDQSGAWSVPTGFFRV
jgi:hypothetical protein